MSEALETAKTHLAEIVSDLRALRRRLMEVLAILPPSPMDQEPESESDEMDAPTEIRSVIRCVLTDSLEPAIRDLQDAVSHPS